MRQTTTCRRGTPAVYQTAFIERVNWVKPSPNITHELSLLTERLIAYRVVRRLKDPSFMSKFSDLASMTRDTLKKWDAEADDIMAEHYRLEAEGNDLFRQYRANQANKRAEFTQMRDAIRDLSGANLPNEPEAAASQASSNSLPPVIAVPTAQTQEPEKPKAIEATPERAALNHHHLAPDVTAKPVLQGTPFPHQ